VLNSATAGAIYFGGMTLVLIAVSVVALRRRASAERGDNPED
jgi:hypothetical protein